MAVDWSTLGPLLDGLEEFPVFDAACYWLDKKPSEELHDDSDVHRAIELIEKHTNRKYLRYPEVKRRSDGTLTSIDAVPVRRDELIGLAATLGVHPPLLFADARGAVPPMPSDAHKLARSPSQKELNNWRKTVGLAAYALADLQQGRNRKSVASTPAASAIAEILLASLDRRPNLSKTGLSDRELRGKLADALKILCEEGINSISESDI